MADHQRVIEFLRDVRQGGTATSQVPTPEIMQMAADYAALCVQANDRLRQCSTFLQQGLRTEAIHLADAPPNLLDLVAQLDLPDPQAWADYCLNNGLPVPPPLQLDRAAQLNDAYAHDQPLETLLSRHRYLALARAPVRERLGIMRQLNSLDAGNGYWEKDIRTFEKARLKELPQAFYSAVKNHDDEALADLMTEVNQEPWFEPVPADLLAGVTDAYNRIQRTSVEIELRKLVEPLRDAFAARSLQECQALVTRWKNAMAAGGVVNISPDLVDEIKPVIAFVNEQMKRDEYHRRFKDSCKAFAALLDADARDAQLETGYARLKEFKEEIPEELTERYRAITAARRKAADQRHKTRLLMIGGSAAAAIVIGLAVLMLVMRSSAASQWADKIHRAIADNTAEGLASAQRYVDDLQKNNPNLLAQPVVAKEVNDLKTKQDQYARDQASVAALVDKLQAARTAATAVAADPAASMRDLSAAGVALQSAIDGSTSTSLAWADPEGRLPAAVSSVQSILNTLRDRVIASVQSELDAIGTRLRAIPASAATPELAAQTAEQINALQSRLAPLRDAPLVDDKTKADIVALADQIAQRRQGAESSSGVAGELQNIRQHATSPADLKEALDQFIARFPDDPHTHDFKLALDRIPPALALQAWQQFAGTFDNNFNVSTQAATQKRLDAVTAFLAAHPDLPIAAAVTHYTEYLRRAIDALADKGTWQNGLADLVTTPLLTDLGIMEISDGRRVYTLGDVKRTEHKFNNQITVTFEALNLKDYSQRVVVTIEPPLVVAQKPVPAPHTKFIADLADNLKLINENNWETFGIDFADQLLRNKQVDIVVKAILVQQALKTEVAVAGPVLGDTYDRTLAELARQTPDQLPWVDRSRISEGTIRALTQTLDAVPPAAAVKQKIAAAKAALLQSLTVDTIGTGVLLKDDAGTWNLSTAVVPANGAKIWLILPDAHSAAPAAAPPAAPPATDPAATSPAATSPAAPAATAANVSTALFLIGTATDGKFVLAAVPPTPQGSIVYITRP